MIKNPIYGLPLLDARVDPKSAAAAPAALNLERKQALAN
jgi:hypothetical protein